MPIKQYSTLPSYMDNNRGSNFLCVYNRPDVRLTLLCMMFNQSCIIL